MLYHLPVIRLSQTSKTKCPPPPSCSVENVKVWLENAQIQCHAPFSACKHVVVTCRTCHFMSSCHVISSCHVTLETDLCVCHCQYSPTHVKDQNPCLCAKMSHAPISHKHVNENMSRHVMIPWSKSGLKTNKIGLISATPPCHMISMSTKTCQTCHDMSSFHGRNLAWKQKS